MNCVLFLSCMTIDTLLTSEIARERIGRLVELPEGYAPRFQVVVPRFQVYVPVHHGRQCIDYSEEFEDASFRFSVEGTSFDFSWEFDQRSGLVRSLRKLRESQNAAGFLDPKTVVKHFKFSNSYKSAFLCAVTLFYNDALTQRGSDFYYKLSEGDELNGTTHATFAEALMNAIEHGSVYGQRGPVNVRFLGGDKGFAFLVDNPRDDFVLKPYTVEELIERYTKKYGAIPEDPTTLKAFQQFSPGDRKRITDQARDSAYQKAKDEAYNYKLKNGVNLPISRGNGIPHMIFGETATVGFERTEATNRVIVGYFV